MYERSNPWEPGYALVMSQLVAIAHNPNNQPSDLVRYMEDNFPYRFSIESRVGFANEPDAHLLYTGTWRLLVILGARTRQLVTLYMDSARATPDIGKDGIYPSIWNAGITLEAWAESIAPSRATQTYVGHSFGGCVASRCAIFKTNPADQSFFASALSFGMPKGFIFNEGPQAPGGAPVWGFQNSFDTLSHYPFTASEAPLMYALNSNRTCALWRRAAWLGGISALLTDGTIIDGQVAPIVTPVGPTDVWSFWVQNEQNGIVEHSPQEYNRRLALNPNIGTTAQYNNPGAQPPVFRQFHQPPQESLPTPAQRAVVIAIAEAQIAANRGPEPEASPYYAVRRSGQWFTEFQGQFIATGQKKQCRALARKLNAAWREWWNVKIVDAGNLAESVDESFPG